ncbi:MAG TPA: hypothetical protein VGF97_18490 [Rhizomicrobium sp.]|jgi:hypothetical protein
MRGIITAVAGIAMMAAAGAASAQQSSPVGVHPAGTLKPNQTQGYGAGSVLTLTYTQNYACVDQPMSNLNFNRLPAESDHTETALPICQAGTDPTINPPGMVGKASTTTDPLYVLIPMFSSNNDTNPDDAISCTEVLRGTHCGPELGAALIKLFGTIPESFKKKPLVFTQCPDGGPAGTCTMHATKVDLAPVLAALGLGNNPPTSNFFVPLPNHSHLLVDSQINQSAEWWQVLPVLVLNANDWPSQDGTSGITSVAALQAAENAGQAVEAPSNFFLYFGSKVAKKDMSMNMNMGR